jgi:hypothetical protein
MTKTAAPTCPICEAPPLPAGALPLGPRPTTVEEALRLLTHRFKCVALENCPRGGHLRLDLSPALGTAGCVCAETITIKGPAPVI